MPPHAYANQGVYTAILTVVDNQSLSSDATHQVTVNAPPRAAFQFSPGTIYIGFSVTFDGSASTDPDGTIASYSWDFGDGYFGTGVQASHGYAARGAFGVELTVVDNLGLSNHTARAITVGDRAPQITSSSPGVGPLTARSEERRVGKECRWRRGAARRGRMRWVTGGARRRHCD